jgi:hypothetical protein
MAKRSIYSMHAHTSSDLIDIEHAMLYLLLYIPPPPHSSNYNLLVLSTQSVTVTEPHSNNTSRGVIVLSLPTQHIHTQLN